MLTLSEYTGAIVMRDENGGQQARLYFTKCVKYPEDFQYSELIQIPYICVNRLYVGSNYRRQGYARKMMKLMFHSNPDVQNYMIVANPDIGSELDMGQLCAFYGTFGFVKVLDIPEGTLMFVNKSSVCQI